jgi:hypothetical protein
MTPEERQQMLEQATNIMASLKEADQQPAGGGTPSSRPEPKPEPAKPKEVDEFVKKISGGQFGTAEEFEAALKVEAAMANLKPNEPEPKPEPAIANQPDPVMKHIEEEILGRSRTPAEAMKKLYEFAKTNIIQDLGQAGQKQREEEQKMQQLAMSKRDQFFAAHPDFAEHRELIDAAVLQTRDADLVARMMDTVGPQGVYQIITGEKITEESNQPSTPQPPRPSPYTQGYLQPPAASAASAKKKELEDAYSQSLDAIDQAKTKEDLDAAWVKAMTAAQQR